MEKNNNQMYNEKGMPIKKKDFFEKLFSLDIFSNDSKCYNNDNSEKKLNYGERLKKESYEMYEEKKERDLDSKSKKNLFDDEFELVDDLSDKELDKILDIENNNQEKNNVELDNVLVGDLFGSNVQDESKTYENEKKLNNVVVVILVIILFIIQFYINNL